MTTPSPDTQKAIPAIAAALGVAKAVRWRILSILFDEGPLPPIDIRKRLGLEQSIVSKQLTLMKRHGLLEQMAGRLYRIPARFVVPGQRALDFGSIVVRLEHTPKH